MALRVLWLIKGLGRGGAEMLLLAHARLAADDISYDVAYVLAQKNALVPDFEAAGVATKLLAGGRPWPLALRSALTVGRPYDVVHCHSPVPASVLRVAVRTLPPARRPKVVTTEHNRWPRYHPATRIVNRLTFGLDDAHVLVADDIRDTLPSKYASTAVTIRHGVDVADLAAAAAGSTFRAELGIAPDVPLVATIANAESKKGYPHLLRAARQVVDRIPGVVFVAAGVGPELPGLEKERDRLGLGDQFRFLGSRDDPAAILGAADVFCLSSLHEGLPVTLMEAMACGVPIVATTAGGIPEAVTHDLEGLLVPPGEETALAEALAAVLTDEKLRLRLGEAARRRAPDFEAVHFVRRLEEMYRGLARGES